MITIRLMQMTDISAVVETHKASFQSFFLSFLGEAFLNELYVSILADASGIGFVAENEGKIQGFVAGTDNPKGFYKHVLRQRWLRFTWASLIPIIKNPFIIPRLLRAFSRSEAEDVHEDCATLMSIAVSPNVQGNGVGKLLVQAFLEDAHRRGIKMVNLTTDQLNNQVVNCFYQELGFRLNSTYSTPEGRVINEYLIELLPTTS